MTDRPEVGGGGLTGATGDLTPPSTDDAFVPGERREAEDATDQGVVTAAQGRRAPATAGDVGNPESRDEGGPTTLATGDGGYGSERGFAPDDPAYRMEARPRPAARPSRQERETSMGGDVLSDEETHL